MTLRILGVTGMDQLLRAVAKLTRFSQEEVYAYIGTQLVDPPYPFFLEFGTSRMPAYPSARPAFFAAQYQAEAAGKQALAAIIASGAAGTFSRGAIRAATQAMALPIENQWKSMARVKTGTYRRSIHTEVP